MADVWYFLLLIILFLLKDKLFSLSFFYVILRLTMSYKTKRNALLLLADGTKFFGKSVASQGTRFGEICFNTGMTGYQEIFTDPS